MLAELKEYARIRPGPFEKTRQEGQGSYFGVRWTAIRWLRELESEEAFRELCDLATSPDREVNSMATDALEKRGDPRAVPALLELLELEDRRAKQCRDPLWRNRHLVTCRALRAIERLGGVDAVPALRRFLAQEKRFYAGEVEVSLFRLTHDLSKPVNAENLTVELKVRKNRFRQGEEMLLEYSMGIPGADLAAWGCEILIDGQVVESGPARVHRGGFSSRGGLSLAGLSPGKHTLTVLARGTDKSDSMTFFIEPGPSAREGNPAQ